MGSKSDVYEVDVLKAVTGQATTILTTTPITPYIALYTATPTDSSAGTEVTGGSYARVSSAGKWAVPSAGSVATNAIITFPTATADWGAITGFAVCSAVSAGSILMWGALTVSKSVLTADTASFASGSIVLTED
jgi:hypothetical protein